MQLNSVNSTPSPIVDLVNDEAQNKGMLVPATTTTVIPVQKFPLTTVTGRTGSLSEINQKILSDFAKDIFENHLVPTNLSKLEDGGIIQKIRSWLPSPFAAGSTLGWAVGTVHGPEVSNWAVGQVASRVFPTPPPATGFLPSISNWFRGAQQVTAAEAARLVITPQLLPFIIPFCSNGMGLTFMAAALLAGTLYHQLAGSQKNKYSLDNLPPPDQLIKLTAEGKIVDASGEEMTLRDLKDICLTIQRYNLTCQLWAVKIEEIEDLIDSYLINRTTYLNGKEVSDADKRIIQVAMDRLKSANPMRYSEEITDAIKLLADNSVSVLKLEDFRKRLEEAQLLKSLKPLTAKDDGIEVLMPIPEELLPGAMFKESDEKEILANSISDATNATNATDASDAAAVAAAAAAAAPVHSTTAAQSECP